MTTPALLPMNVKTSKQTMQHKNNSRQIIREEIQREKQLKKLEQKYKAKEISDFEYRVAVAMIKMEPLTTDSPNLINSTTA